METQKMTDFKTTINKIDFNFQGVTERNARIYRVTADTSAFKMMTDDEGIWGIWQQVPRWIKELEEQLGDAITAHEAK